MTELNDLGMAATRFETQIESQPPTTKGADKVEFLLSPNPGEPLKPLAKIASGGEASRIMLAIKSVLAKSGSSPTMIFDEIDTGVGGRTAFAVAKKLESLSGKTQIICITHLPQIASRAALAHFYIEKKAESDKTEVFVKRLSQSERVIEISRMLGGAPEDSAAIEHAKQMLQNIA
jgi:DNA repair protein RecN (Recombination protein N)